jgi:hypothetical protein
MKFSSRAKISFLTGTVLILLLGLFQNFTNVVPSLDEKFDYIINVNEFGAIANDSIDDTLSINNASEYAKQILLKDSNSKIAVVFPAGNYNVSSLVEIIDKNGNPINYNLKNRRPLKFYSGISYIGIYEGSQVKKARFVNSASPCLKYQDVNQFSCHANNKWAHIVNGVYLSNKPLVLENLEIDGNRNNQGPQELYELEQKSSLYLNSTKDLPINVVINNCNFNESPGDGITANNYVNLNAKNIKANANFRGGITLVGTGVVADVDHFFSWGDNNPGWGGIKRSFISFQVEASSHKEKALDDSNLNYIKLTLKNARVNGIVDLGFAGDGSYFHGDNIIMYGGFFNYAGLNGFNYKLDTEGTIKNSILRTLSGNTNGGTYDSGHIYAPGKLTFENVKFYTETNKSLVSTGVHIRFYNSYSTYTDQFVKFKNCYFNTIGDGAKFSSAIKIDPYRMDTNNNIYVDKAWVYSGFDSIFEMPNGGSVHAKNITSSAKQVFKASGTSDYSLNLSITNLYLPYINHNLPLGYISMLSKNDHISLSSTSISGKEPIDFKKQIGLKIKRKIELTASLTSLQIEGD